MLPGMNCWKKADMADSWAKCGLTFDIVPDATQVCCADLKITSLAQLTSPSLELNLAALR